MHLMRKNLNISNLKLVVANEEVNSKLENLDHLNSNSSSNVGFNPGQAQDINEGMELVGTQSEVGLADLQIIGLPGYKS